MNIVPIVEEMREEVREFFTQHWGSAEMVYSHGVFRCDELDGFVAVNNNGAWVGLVTYFVHNNECEVVSLDSMDEGKGIGTVLLRVVEEEARKRGCHRVYLVTTNDNLNALRFYQKRGYQCVRVIPNAVEKARKIKPQIPTMSEDGIPIRDEFVLEKRLERKRSSFIVG
ncbi:acetyltransferase (GNAT) family protein [Thermolongibacillus altinsuensis]|uniref:Acetyltransferase (GNAT) family protein n=1 Tax=Thermolongibacillus altinsuensis TaxID=575256 RepID=A0A4R1QCW2_9BACL|nr:GNAT family N-acetyltransferase [Thermolongibacillus altinsuensis]TCL45942.1 acetyltransferase (GNAT) family protein [Thermolongibacillus altinsuensis]